MLNFNKNKKGVVGSYAECVSIIYLFGEKIMLTTKEKGDIGLTKIIAELTENCFNVSIPIAEHLKYDLIVEKNGKMFRVQSKYTSVKKNKIDIKIASSWSNKAGTYAIKRQKGDYDVLAAYCPQMKSCYFIHDNSFNNGRSIALKVSKSKSKYNSRKEKLASDYEDPNKAFC
ncbi:hypothetical protein LCGC14_0934850 [marine sediment metagenome]|uniref:PD(D/E)XK endonuclease domain-containing protein n=1 Tax=marine sediment metagenome TaxID=412755 RepID=A0A0F9P7Z9_9ZZZZ